MERRIGRIAGFAAMAACVTFATRGGAVAADSTLSVGNRGMESVTVSVGTPSGFRCGSAAVAAQSSAAFPDAHAALRYPECRTTPTFTVTWRRTADPNESHRCVGTAAANSFYTIVQARGPDECSAY